MPRRYKSNLSGKGCADGSGGFHPRPDRIFMKPRSEIAAAEYDRTVLIEPAECLLVSLGLERIGGVSERDFGEDCRFVYRGLALQREQVAMTRLTERLETT